LQFLVIILEPLQDSAMYRVPISAAVSTLVASFW